MPKLSVYIPDELWERAKALPGGRDGKQNNSQVVQQALERLLDEQQARHAAFADGALRDPSRIAAIVEHLREGARQGYERGYSAGLELAEATDFDELRMIMNTGGLRTSAMDWLGELPDGSPERQWWGKYWAAWSEHPDNAETILDNSEPFRAGAADALADVWQALRSNAWGMASTGNRAASADDVPADSEEKGE